MTNELNEDFEYERHVIIENGVQTVSLRIKPKNDLVSLHTSDIVKALRVYKDCGVIVIYAHNVKWGHVFLSRQNFIDEEGKRK